MKTLFHETEQGALKRMASIFVELKFTDGKWKSYLRDYRWYVNDDGTYKRNLIVETAFDLLSKIDYSVWKKHNVVRYGDELVSHLKKFGYQYTPTVCRWEDHK